MYFHLLHEVALDKCLVKVYIVNVILDEISVMHLIKRSKSNIVVSLDNICHTIKQRVSCASSHLSRYLNMVVDNFI